MREDQIEAIKLLTKMAERRTDLTISIDSLHLYTAFAQHVLEVRRLEKDELTNIIRHIKEKSLADYPALLADLKTYKFKITYNVN